MGVIGATNGAKMPPTVNARYMVRRKPELR